MIERWTESQIEDAHRIVNDIAEDVENPRDTKKKLRQALAIYADLLWESEQQTFRRGDAKIIQAIETLQEAMKKP